MRVIFVVLFLIFSIFQAQAKGPFGKIKVGHWSGGAYTHDATGQFTGCIASAGYRSGIIFTVRVSSEMQWQLAFSHRDWQLSPGVPFPIALTFDGQSPFNVNGKPLSKNLVAVEMPDSSELIGQFRRSRMMTAYAQGQLFQFRLDNTSVLLPALVNCVVTVKRDGIRNAGNFVIEKTTAQPNVANTAGSSLRSEPQRDLPAEYQIEAIELATNFILKTSMRNARVLPRAETPATLASMGAAWQSDEAAGFVRIIPPADNLKGIDVAAAVAGNDAKDCKAKFMSGRTAELVDSEPVFRGISSCEDSEGKRVSHYFIVPRRKGGFVLFSVVASEKLGVGFNETSSEKRLGDFRDAALRVGGN